MLLGNEELKSMFDRFGCGSTLFDVGDSLFSAVIMINKEMTKAPQRAIKIPVT